MSDPAVRGGAKKFPQLAIIRLAGVGTARYGVNIGLGLVLSASFIAAAIVSSLIFAELLGRRDYGYLTELIIWLAVILAVRPLVMMAREWSSSDLAERMKIALRDRVVVSLVKAGPMRTPKQSSAQVQSMMTDGVELTQSYYCGYVPQLAVAIATGTFVTAWLWQYSAWIALIQLGAALAAFAVPRIWDAALAERGREHWEAYAALNHEFVDSMLGMTTLKAFNAAAHRETQLAKRSERLLRTTLGQLRLSLGETGVSAAIMVLGPAIGLALGIWEVGRGNLPATELFMITLLSAEMFRPVRDLANMWHAGFMGLSASRELHHFLTTFDHLGELRIAAADAATACDALPTSNPNETIVALDEVRYRYHQAATPALQDITASIPRGKATAIIGASGSGKSTLLGLLLGMDTPTGGHIATSASGEWKHPASPRGIDGIALVPQDPLIFAGTIASNMRDGKADASDEEIRRALQLAQLGDFADKLSAPVFERGENLSGGQRQRLAIARALIARPALLILDESTSALDTATETAILTAIRQAEADISLIVVTHRLDVAAQLDYALVLAKTRLVEAGPVAELLASDGAFAKQIGQGAK